MADELTANKLYDETPIAEPGESPPRAGAGEEVLTEPGTGGPVGSSGTSAVESPVTPRDGAAHYKAGKLAEAEAAFREDIRRRPRDAGLWHNCAVALAGQGKLVEAVAHFEEALRLAPGAAETHRNLALALTQQGQRPAAEKHLREAVRLAPDMPAARHELGKALRIAGRLDEAVVNLREAARLQDDVADAHHDLGLALAEMARPGDARRCYERALALRAEFPEALNNLGILLEDQGAHDLAETRYRAALRLQPNSADTLNNLGVTLAAQRRHEEAVECYRQALRIRPGAPLPWNNLGNALRTLGAVDEAIDCLRKAIALRSDYAEAHNNLGIGLVQLGLHKQALESYDRALHLRPQYPEAHLNRSLAWLGESDFVRGWTEYEWRWNVPGTKRRACRQPLWSGVRAPNQTLLIYCEQGLGDTLHFIRYAELARKRAQRVIAEVQAPLVPLLARCCGIDELIPAGSPVPAFDVRLPLLSLPGALGTQLETIPADVPYVFADPQRVESWRERMANLRGFRVGIGWQGNPQYRGDRQRSIPLFHFARLAEIAHVQLISLQKGEGAAQIAELDRPLPLVEFDDLDAAGGAFMDTAAILESVDLVITSDTALAHLAGAMAVETWVALPLAADWRWLRDREDCPWYPTLRLFRQERPGDWSGVFARMAAELELRMARRQKPLSQTDRPASAQAEFEKGTELAKSGKLDAAADCLRAALKIDPDFAEALHNLGVVLARTEHYDDAIATFRRALQINEQYGEAAANLGLAYLQSGQAQQSIGALRQALCHAAGTPDVYNHLGVALSRCARTAEAVAAYQTALRLAPEFAPAHINLSRAYLALGRYEEAWIEQEWRWSTRTSKQRKFSQPRWTGEPLQGRTILVYADETREDAQMCLNHLKTLCARGSRMIVACSETLRPVFAEWPGNYAVVSLGEALPPHDVYVPLLSLPWLLSQPGSTDGTVGHHAHQRIT